MQLSKAIHSLICMLAHTPVLLLLRYCFNAPLKEHANFAQLIAHSPYQFPLSSPPHALPPLPSPLPSLLAPGVPLRRRLPAPPGVPRQGCPCAVPGGHGPGGGPGEELCACSALAAAHGCQVWGGKGGREGGWGTGGVLRNKGGFACIAKGLVASAWGLLMPSTLPSHPFSIDRDWMQQLL